MRFFERLGFGGGESKKEPEYIVGGQDFGAEDYESVDIDKQIEALEKQIAELEADTTGRFQTELNEKREMLEQLRQTRTLGDLNK